MPQKKEPLLHVPVPGDRGTITMRRMTTSEFLRLRKREMTDIETVEMTVSAIVKYLPGQDPLDLAIEDMFELTNSWIEARVEEAVPPPTA